MSETPICEVALASVRGGHHCERVGGRELLFVDTKEGVRVYDGVCPHLGGSLLEGKISTRAVVCPWHAYAFDSTTGRCLTTPGGIWRSGGLQKGNRQPMDISLRPVRYRLDDGLIKVYDP